MNITVTFVTGKGPSVVIIQKAGVTGWGEPAIIAA